MIIAQQPLQPDQIWQWPQLGATSFIFLSRHIHLGLLPAAEHPAVAAALSAVVMKLLSKNKEDRYQTARGAQADLQMCLDRLRNDTKRADSSTALVTNIFCVPLLTDVVLLQPLRIGQADRSGWLHLPESLYGAKENVRELSAAFNRVRLEATLDRSN